LIATKTRNKSVENHLFIDQHVLKYTIPIRRHSPAIWTMSL